MQRFKITGYQTTQSKRITLFVAYFSYRFTDAPILHKLMEQQLLDWHHTNAEPNTAGQWTCSATELTSDSHAQSTHGSQVHSPNWKQAWLASIRAFWLSAPWQDRRKLGKYRTVGNKQSSDLLTHASLAPHGTGVACLFPGESSVFSNTV